MTSPASGPKGVRTLRAPGGQALILEADRPAAGLQTSRGDRLSLGPEGSHLRSVGDLVVEAPGRRITLRAASIEFERG